MSSSTRVLSYLMIGAGLSFALACGKGTSLTDPTATAGSSAPTTAAAAPASGATIAGTVQGVGAAARGGVGALSSGLRVTVVGTGQSTTTDGSGHFTLTGVPAGDVQLRFQGPGVDAMLDLGGLQSGQTITITIQVSGSEASIVSPADTSQVEVTGKVESVGAGQLVVAGQTIMVDASTSIYGNEGATLKLSDLKVGDSVEVKATRQTDGSLLAVKIELAGDNGGSGQQVELKGSVQSVGTNQLMVDGQTVMVNASTFIQGDEGKKLTLADLKVGDSVEVQAVKQTDGTLLAVKIELDHGSGSGGSGGSGGEGGEGGEG
jgi:hypothetical protein